MAKKHDVPDIDSLLGTIAEKRPELPKTEIQHVQPVAQTPAGATPESEREPAKREAGKTGKRANDDAPKKAPGGRPTSKRPDVEYVKISPVIPKALKKQAELALLEERFDGHGGSPITTLDAIIELALTRLLQKK